MHGSGKGWTRICFLTTIVCFFLGIVIGLLEFHPLTIVIDECIGYRLNEKTQYRQRGRLFGLLPVEVRYYAVTKDGEKLQAERLRRY